MSSTQLREGCCHRGAVVVSIQVLAWVGGRLEWLPVARWTEWGTGGLGRANRGRQTASGLVVVRCHLRRRRTGRFGRERIAEEDSTTCRLMLQKLVASI